ncbi:hypothetical protein [Microvirga mediterraneensis]|uniref:Uncharacterized protein n=1 Tax=Microvirga mediterraneensis TaxID=2754695 RepID=A0A838BRI8_9HYPH|nr:hypothetical protein [Microvirga mediterraneensis]MBA1157615.1 hypothetical protein [Microvirga mediterraneensis]
MSLNVNASPITQVASTVAEGGAGLGGHGGDATAVTNQSAESLNYQSMNSSDHFGWGSPDLNVNASPITQAASTDAHGGAGLFGSGGDAFAMTNQDAHQLNDQSSYDHFPIYY